MKIDVARCLQAMKKIVVVGLPEGSVRQNCIEEAIELIQIAPEKALEAHYIGVKNYAHFGDQREDHQYGYGPRHGVIVFSIGRRSLAELRTENNQPDSDCIYLLECVRDFGSVEVAVDAGKFSKFNLLQVIERYQKAVGETAYFGEILDRELAETSSVSK